MRDINQSGQKLLARCRNTNCSHIWTVAYLPMQIDDAARCGARATCPKCGDGQPFVHLPDNPNAIDIGLEVVA